MMMKLVFVSMMMMMMMKLVVMMMMKLVAMMMMTAMMVVSVTFQIQKHGFLFDSSKSMKIHSTKLPLEMNYG